MFFEFCTFSGTMLQVKDHWGYGYFARLLSPEMILNHEHCFRALVVPVGMKIWAKYPGQFRLIFEDTYSNSTFFISFPLMPGKQQLLIGGDRRTLLAETTLVQGSCLDLCKFYLILF